MKRYSIVWWISVFLKLMTVYVFVSTTSNVLFVPALIVSASPAAFYVIGVPFFLPADIARALQTLWQILSGLTVGVILLSISELLRMVANTEAYARGTYSLSRRRTTGTEISKSEEKNYVRPLPGQSLPVFDTHEPTSDDLQYSPPERHRRQRLPSSPVRRVTVLRDRAPHEEHPARPSGAVEVVDSLNAVTDHHDLGRLPFDRI